MNPLTDHKEKSKNHKKRKSKPIRRNPAIGITMKTLPCNNSLPVDACNNYPLLGACNNYFLHDTVVSYHILSRLNMKTLCYLCSVSKSRRSHLWFLARRILTLLVPTKPPPPAHLLYKKIFGMRNPSLPSSTAIGDTNTNLGAHKVSIPLPKSMRWSHKASACVSCACTMIPTTSSSSAILLSASWQQELLRCSIRPWRNTRWSFLGMFSPPMITKLCLSAGRSVVLLSFVSEAEATTWAAAGG